MPAPLHDVRLVVLDEQDRPKTIDTYTEFDVTSDMLELADQFMFRCPLTRERWELLAPDAEVMLLIDDSRVLTGFIDDRDRSLGRSGSTIEIVGRDRGGRLVDESAPLVTFQGKTLEDLVLAVVEDWFPTVTFSNARNRDLIRGRGRRKAQVGGEPVLNGRGRDLRKKVEPGESRAQVLEYVLEESRLLGWSTADAKEFVVGLPNYSQAPQWQFFVGREGSARWSEINVLDYRRHQTVAERYQKVIACGSSKGSTSDYGSKVTRRRGQAIDDSVFRRPKTLIVSDDDIRSAAQAQTRADREMAFRNGQGDALEVDVVGYGQALGGAAGAQPAIFAFDTMAHVEDEELGERGDWLVTRVRYHTTKQDGQVSTLSLVPRGTELVPA